MNQKHIEILRNVLNLNHEQMKFWMSGQGVGLSFTLSEALAAMQVLQDEIDDLKAQNKELRERINNSNNSHWDD